MKWDALPLFLTRPSELGRHWFLMNNYTFLHGRRNSLKSGGGSTSYSLKTTSVVKPSLTSAGSIMGLCSHRLGRITAPFHPSTNVL